MIVYPQYNYLYPPRPESAIPRALLHFYESRGFWAQVKKNGTCTVIFAKGDDVRFKTRRNGDHKAWAPLADHTEFFKGFENWNVFVAELIHSKTPHIKNQLYIFDQIVSNGIQLVGSTFADRQDLLQSHWAGTDEIDQTRINSYVSVAKNFKSNFLDLFLTLKPEDEGLVLKNPKGTLNSCVNSSNAGWQVKCLK